MEETSNQSLRADKQPRAIGSCLAIINKIQTTQDGGARVTLDLNPEAADIIQELLSYKLKGEPLLSVGFAEFCHE